MDDISEDLRQRISIRLNDLGLTAITAARKAGLPRDTLRNLFRENRNLPRADTLIRIAEALETSVGYLLGEIAFPGNDPNDPGVLTLAEKAILAARPVPVVARAAADEWAPWPSKPLTELQLNVPGFDEAQLFSVLLGDFSMSTTYHKGEYIIAVKGNAAGLRDGDHVVFTRDRDGEAGFEYEWMVREVLIDRYRGTGFVSGLLPYNEEFPFIPLFDKQEIRGQIQGVVVANIGFTMRPAKPGLYTANVGVGNWPGPDTFSFDEGRVGRIRTPED